MELPGRGGGRREERGASSEDNDDDDDEDSSSEDVDARDCGRRGCVSFEAGIRNNRSATRVDSQI